MRTFRALLLLTLLPVLSLAQKLTVGPNPTIANTPGTYNIWRDRNSGILMETGKTGIDAPTKIAVGAVVGLPKQYVRSLGGKAAVRNLSTLTAPVPPVQISVIDPVSGGTFYLDSTDTSTPDNKGTVLVTASGLRYKRPVGPEESYRAAWFDVAASGADMAANAQYAIDQATAAGRGLIMPPGFTKLNSGLTVKIGSSVIEKGGNKAYFDFSGMSSGVALKLTGDNTSDLYQQNANGVSGLIAIGPGRNSNVTGILYDSDSEPGAAHTYLRDFTLYSFGKGIVLQRNAYLIGFEHGGIHNCGVGIEHLDGFTNSGENIFFDNVKVFNSALCVRMGNPAGALNFVGASFDYSEKVFEVTGGIVNVDLSHIESGGYSDYPVKVAGDGGVIHIDKSWIINSANTVAPPSWAHVDSPKGVIGLTITNTRINNIATTSGYFADGDGTFVTSGINSFTSGNLTIFSSRNNNALVDGSVEADTLLDEYLVMGTAPRTSRTSAQNCVIAPSTDYAYRGSKSLKWTKVFGAGSTSTVWLWVPIEKNRRYAASVRYKKPGTTTSSATYFSFYYAGGYQPTADGGYPKFTRRESLGTDTRSWTSAPVDWTMVISPTLLPVAPPWATHMLLEVNGVNVAGVDGSLANAAVVYLDDFQVIPF